MQIILMSAKTNSEVQFFTEVSTYQKKISNFTNNNCEEPADAENNSEKEQTSITIENELGELYSIFVAYLYVNLFKIAHKIIIEYAKKN